MGHEESQAYEGEGPATGGESPNDRPTVPPPFDPAEFARDSETALSTVPDPESSAPTVRRLAVAVPRVSAIISSGPELEQAPIINLRDALGADAVPVLLASPDELGWLDLSPGASRLLGYVNGVWSLNRLCATANVAPEDGALILLELAEQGIVSFR